MGTVVCVSGLLAAGKTSFIKNFMRHLEDKGMKIKFMPEIYSDGVRDLVHSNLPVADSFMLAHRIQMSFDAVEISKLYDVVLMERCYIDHLAFNEAFDVCGQLDSELVSQLRIIVNELNPPTPDHFIFLDIPPETSLERRKERGSSGKGVFTIEFLKELRSSYLKLINNLCGDALILDWTQYGANECMDQIFEEIARPNQQCLTSTSPATNSVIYN